MGSGPDKEQPFPPPAVGPVGLLDGFASPFRNVGGCLLRLRCRAEAHDPCPPGGLPDAAAPTPVPCPLPALKPPAPLSLQTPHKQACSSSGHLALSLIPRRSHRPHTLLTEELRRAAEQGRSLQQPMIAPFDKQHRQQNSNRAPFRNNLKLPLRKPSVATGEPVR